MPRAIRAGQLLLLDACCLINLLATERAREILRALPYRCAVPRFVAEREVFCFSLKSEGGRNLPRPISLAEIHAEIGVEILDIESPSERAELLRFGELLDQGEAHACALAVERNGGVATDDRKALASLARLAPQVPIIQTSEILFEACAANRWTEQDAGKLLRAIRDRASFIPRRGAPHFDWWTRLIGSPRS